MPILILGGGPASDPSGFIQGPPATFTAATAQVVTRGALFVARSSPDYITSSVPFQAQSLPLAVTYGGAATLYHAQLSGLPGPVLSWDYSHTGQDEELTAVVRGLFGTSMPTVILNAEAQSAGGSTLARLPTRTFQNMGQEPQEDVGAFRTTFRFKESVATILKRLPLEEMIHWKQNPTPDPCLNVRQRQNISTLVHEIMRRYGDFSLEFDPLAKSFFEEGRKEFSTEGLTPMDVWDATYGLLGMGIYMLPDPQARRFVGRFADPVDTRGGPYISPDWITQLSQGRELLQTPVRLTLTGADQPLPLKPEIILAMLGSDPAAAEVARELLPEQEWYDPPESAGTARIQRGYKKSGGQMVSTVEITTDDIEVNETVGDEPFYRLWRGVATGYKRSRTTYDPACPGRPMLEITESKSWAFDAQTVGGSFQVYGPGLYRSLSVGDLVSDETTVTTYRYSPQGYLAAKTTSTRRLASLKQDGAELTPDERGPLEAREYTVTTQTEQWQPIGGGRWLHTPGVSGQTLVPVYDAESGEAIRTASVARASPDAPRITDQAPPSYDCNACDLKEILDPTGAVFRVGDAGFADAQETQIAFLEPEALIPVGTLLLARDWGRLITSLSVPLPLGYLPGTWVSFGEGQDSGRVRELRMGQAEGETVITSTLTLSRPDYLLGKPNQAARDDLLADYASGRAVMLAGKPGGALARIVRGWNVTAVQPITELGFIAFRTGFPPRPGDEIEWKLVRGQREATGAR
ncbi:hypothetical protein ACFP9V_19080 [Deinococcus radiopugnans]|uniref:Uncharacterized protein n=1 Tax=Deinococcus radiopugnans ATCC 19172 TaxID=585398 RepID=A0A5C4Y931_9DEIO|nr:hypothetical protein [Deinococcus radiopugnans]MBB6016810.1 hypothetical protein [Deinococcus radiopugnans ATCC 19172]TNM71901.1 hypothetical protein FHR04_05910 [Deinococcus radiopugnans ATCC 19172]